VLLDEVGDHRLSAPRTQRELVETELARLAGLAQALDRAIASVEHGDEPQEESMLIGFDPSDYEDEAHKRWGTPTPIRRRDAGRGPMARSNAARSRRRRRRLSGCSPS